MRPGIINLTRETPVASKKYTGKIHPDEVLPLNLSERRLAEKMARQIGSQGVSTTQSEA
jgi:hypothetical protein